MISMKNDWKHFLASNETPMARMDPQRTRHGVIEMISGIISMLSRVLDRLGLPICAKPRSPAAACCQCSTKYLRFAAVPFILVCCLASQSKAADNLECPEIGVGRVP